MLQRLSKFFSREAAGGPLQKAFAVVVLVIAVAIVVYTDDPSEPKKARGAEEAQNPSAYEVKKREATEAATKKREAAIAELSLYFYGSGLASARVEPGGNSVTVYVARSQFESIPFPDRKGFIEKAGKLWCEQGGVLSTLVISDIRSGERLSKYSCTTGWVSMP